MHRVSVPFILRVLLGMVWIAGAIFNAVWTLPNADEALGDFGTTATFSPYRWFFDTVVGMSPAFWAVLLILAEVGLGILLLARDPWARIGLLLSVAWSTFLFFLIWPYTLSTVVFLVLAVVLLRYEHPRSLLDALHRHDSMRVAHHRGA